MAQPPSQFGQVDLTDDDVVTGFHEVSRVPYWVNCGIYVLSAAAIERFPEKGDHETTIFPELADEGSLRAYRHTGLWLTVNTPKELRRADEHVSAASGVARVTTPYSFAPRHIDKPWGYELIWAESETYVGKVLFVRAGQALSLQYHEQKDESWLVQSGRASLELGQVGGELETVRDRDGGLLPLPARHRASRHRARGHDDPRGLDTAPRRRRAARRPLRAP